MLDYRTPRLSRPTTVEDITHSAAYHDAATACQTRGVATAIHRRALLGATAALLAASIAAPAIASGGFPSKPVVIVVPTATGGANDAMARIIAQGLSQKLGKPVVVENKAGANGAIASEAVARAVPDGHTILFGYIATHGINPAMQKLRYDPIKDFEAIGKVAVSPTVMVATTALTATTAKDVIALAKAKPGSMSFASAGAGTVPHLAGEMFLLSTGTEMIHVPYRGSAPAAIDTISGTTQIMFPSLFTAYPYIKLGKLKPLGLAGDKRVAMLPDLPTLAEQGIADVDVSQWYAMFAPAKTPKPIIDRLNREMNAVLAEPQVVKMLGEQGADVETSTPEQLKAFVEQDLARWKGVVTAAKITAN